MVVGSKVVKSPYANLRCDGVVRKALDEGDTVLVVVEPFKNNDGNVSMLVYANGDYRLISALNVQAA